MSLKYGLLGTINWKSMTGYELDREFKESLQYIWHATTSQIYSELGKMEQDGWLISERVVQDEKPNRRVYSITEKGRAELLEWLSAPEINPKGDIIAKNAFLLKVLFAGYTSKESSLKLLHSFREIYLAAKTAKASVREAIARDETDTDQEVTMYWKLVALHGEIIHEARLKWVEQAIKIVEAER